MDNPSESFMVSYVWQFHTIARNSP